MLRNNFSDAKILIIDDEEEKIALISELLHLSRYQNTRGMSDSREAWAVFAEYKPDLVILDLHMSHFDGFDVLRQLQPLIEPDDYLPIIIVTGDTSRDTRERALSGGAMDFVSKPYNAAEILLRVRNLLDTRWLHLQLRQEKQNLETRVWDRTKELEMAYDEVVDKLAIAAEYRDDDTGEHARRVGTTSQEIAIQLGYAPEEARKIGKAALLHDVGKIGVPDVILLKAGSLDTAELQHIRQHTSIGARILGGSRSEILQLAETIALTHHEKWDGTGYMGLRGEAIPMVGRIVAVADVFDALTGARPYKEPWPLDAALEEIVNCAGTQFDPRVVDAFLSALSKGDGLQAVLAEDLQLRRAA
ncbi:MAG: cyclic di-GMP phosphodiesterase [Fimbriimonadaceae bacterium]|jgi:putative two-component system response regulator|nr:cyclic di-GMP phosphodiesterase [Fimbriimonadaceae bacterium]